MIVLTWPGPMKPSTRTAPDVRDFRAVEHGLNGGRRQDVVGEDAEIAEAERAAC